jgi:hypothetical protein
MDRHFEITYANGGKDWFTAKCIADYFAKPQDWGRSKDSLKNIVKVEESSLGRGA